MNNLLLSYHISEKNKLRNEPWGKMQSVRITVMQWWVYTAENFVIAPLYH